MVNEVGRSVLYLMCCVRLRLPSRAVWGDGSVLGWRFAASVRAYGAVLVESALGGVIGCWQQRVGLCDIVC
jgi:hypothetical protein